ncbi:MAG: hypothetical protein ISR65_13440 [Bacteriovoracaceae bacterium]|nr:hypothetical protein [Bacteriovoracaceae bacterium]
MVSKTQLKLLLVIICLLSTFLCSFKTFAQEDPDTALILKYHTEHAYHVRQLGLILYKLTDQFSDVDADILNRFLYMHELSKRNFITGAPINLASAVDGDTPSFYKLFKADITKLTKSEYDLAMSFLNYYNDSDEEVAIAFFKREGLLGPNQVLEDSPLVQKYLRIEKIANIVERGSSKASEVEFGRAVLPGHTYLDNIMHDRDSAKLALRLHHEYYNVNAVQSEASRFVRNYDEYRLYNFTHILRVTRLGAALLKGDAAVKFWDIDQKILEEFLLLHDQSKINGSDAFLNRHALQEESESITSKLYQNYGIDFAAIPDDWKKETGTLVKHLNEIDLEVAADFFRKKGILGQNEDIAKNTLVQKYLQIEKIADLVDRGSSPVTQEEFGRAMIPAHTFFIKVLKDFESAAHAQFLEDNYDKIVRGDEYLGNVPVVRLAFKKHQWDASKRRFKNHRGECMQIMTEHFLSNFLPSLSVRSTVKL